MHPRLIGLLLAAALAAGCSRPSSEPPAADTGMAAAAPAAGDVLADLSAATGRTSFTRLVGADDALVADLPMLEAHGTGRVPNTLRAIAVVPKYAEPFARTYRIMLAGGRVDPALKMAMAYRVAELHSSAYVAAHMARLLRAAHGGPALLEAVRAGAAGTAGLAEATRVALRYAEWLTLDVLGVTPDRFAQVRAHYTDGEIVELTAAIGFFNFLDRFVEAQRLPLEPWAIDTAPELPVWHTPRLKARVTLTDAAIAEAAPRGPNSVNSIRAMALAPEVGEAWWSMYRAIQRDPVVSDDILYHVSFAVSMANGCRYCSMHSVRGLADLGVDPAKLMAMETDDSLLSPRELAAVGFARAVTEDPTSATGEDWVALTAAFGEDGALEVLVRACEFALMNRFTDNLGLPTEDVAVQTYLEIHGEDGRLSQP